MFWCFDHLPEHCRCQAITVNYSVSWRSYWQHCSATQIVTCKVMWSQSGLWGFQLNSDRDRKVKAETSKQVAIPSKQVWVRSRNMRTDGTQRCGGTQDYKKNNRKPLLAAPSPLEMLEMHLHFQAQFFYRLLPRLRVLLPIALLRHVPLNPVTCLDCTCLTLALKRSAKSRPLMLGVWLPWTYPYSKPQKMSPAGRSKALDVSTCT